MLLSIYRFIAVDGRDSDSKDRAWLCPDRGRQTQGAGTVMVSSVRLCHVSVNNVYECMLVVIKKTGFVLKSFPKI